MAQSSKDSKPSEIKLSAIFLKEGNQVTLPAGKKVGRAIDRVVVGTHDGLDGPEAQFSASFVPEWNAVRMAGTGGSVLVPFLNFKWIRVAV